MRIANVFVLMATFTVSAVAAQAANVKLKVELAGTEEGSKVATTLSADRQLESVKFSFDGEAWQGSEATGEGGTAYKMLNDRAATDGRDVAILAKIKDSEEHVLVTGELDTSGKEPTLVDVKGHKGDLEKLNSLARPATSPTANGTQSSPLEAGTNANQVAGIAAYQARFLQLINNYRSGLGLRALQYDSTLESYAARNNQMGGGHKYFVSGGQIWFGSSGGASVDEAFQAWRRSPGHDQIMRGASYSHVGISTDGRQYTADFR